MAEVIDIANSTLISNKKSDTEEDVAAGRSVKNSAIKKTRFSFNEQLDVLLCKAISECGAHAPPIKEKTKLMNKACDIFVNTLLQHVQDMHAEPKGKTCSDCFDLIAN